jgi:predicted ATPase
MAEAVEQFQKGLDQLALLPDTRERQRQELELRSGLGPALLLAKGYAAPETGNAYARARKLWEELGSPSEFLGVPSGQSVYHLYRGELDLALRLDEDLLRLSSQRGDAAGLLRGHFSSGRDLFFVGRFALSRSHLEEALALCDPNSSRRLIQQISGDYRGESRYWAESQTFLGIVLFCAGFLDQAMARSSAAIADARRRRLPSLAGNLATGIRLSLIAGDDAALGEWLDQLVIVTTEQGFPHWRAMVTICRGWVAVKDGNVAEGISLVRSGSAASRTYGAWRPHNIALLAAACEITGEIEEPLALLDEALQVAGRTGERWFVAELNRQKGQLLLKQGHAEATEELYRKALSIAREQEAKLWELRAAASLARLRRDQGRHAEARDLLAPVYGWFTEGFDTPDLKEARALLEALNP